MKVVYVIYLLSILGFAWAANDELARILEYEFQNDGSGPYYFKYLTSNGQSREERSDVEDAGIADQSLVVRGSYSYTGPDGIVCTVRYTADHNGFHPEGDHINVPPYIAWPKGHHHQDDDGGHVPLRDPSHVVQIQPPTQKPPHGVQGDEMVSPVYLPTTPKPPRSQFDGYPTTQYLPSRPTRPPPPPPPPHPRPEITTLPPRDDDAYYYTTPRPTPYSISSTLLPSTRRAYRHNANQVTAASDNVPKMVAQRRGGGGAPVLPLMRLLQDRE